MDHSNGSETLVLVRLSAELSTKARGTRRRFMRHLVENTREALSTLGVRFHVESHWTRLFVRVEAPPAALGVLKRIPGISSYSPVLARCRADLDEIVRVGKERFASLVKGRSYAVRARRSGTHPFSSSDVMRALGAALNADARVDLTNPDVEVSVEVRDQDVYFFSGREEGAGGLPLGVEGRATCLISGGFDSAVAAWLMLKRGVQLDYVFCNLAGDAYERSVALVTKVLADDWSYGTRPRLHVIDFGPVLDDLRAKSRPRYWQVVLKRLMYRAGDHIAQEARAQGLVTGEAIGQVSSQTLVNLAAIDRASSLPVFRPLIGFDKMDIVELSRRLGTFELSSKVQEYCAIAPGNPATAASVRETEEEEAKLDLSVLERAVAERKVLDLKALQAADLVVSYVFTEQVPDNAVVVDVRDEAEWEDWHYPGSIHMPSWQLTDSTRGMDRDRHYVLYCDRGIQSAQAAEFLQRKGYEAYALKGGTAALRRMSEEAENEEPE